MVAWAPLIRSVGNECHRAGDEAGIAKGLCSSDFTESKRRGGQGDPAIQVIFVVRHASRRMETEECDEALTFSN